MKLYDLVNFRNLKQCGKMTERTRLFTGYSCNIKCKFCFYKGRKEIPKVDGLIYQQLIVGKNYGIRDWDISGGEPTILPHWFEMLEKMSYMKFRNIACITNGYKFADPDFLAKSMDHGLNEVLFSLHGSRRHIHDQMTGIKGSFDYLQRAISNAMYNNIKIRINVVVTKDNYKDLPEIARYVDGIIHPTAFNFLPFRMENSASKDNVVKYSDIVPYIKDAIDILDDDIKISIRYVPFCLFKGYEEYVAGYLQREFDEYEWNEYLIRKFDEGIKNDGKLPPFSGNIDYDIDKWKLEIDALHKSIKHVANHSIKCLSCKYLHVCDGIWYSYAKVWGTEEFKPIKGDKIKCIISN